jgi:hypothetical protein
MKTRILACLIGVLLLAGSGLQCLAADKKAAKPASPPAFGKEEAETALAIAKTFIIEVDKDDGHPWGYFSPLAQKQTTEAQWKVAMVTLKAISGRVVRRENLVWAYLDRLPDAPPGRYFIFDFDSKFERFAMNERVVMVQEGATWKVAGYFRTKRVP